MAGSGPALRIQSRRIVRGAFLAGAAVRELSDFLPRHRRAAPVGHHPHPSRCARRSASFGLKPCPRLNVAHHEIESRGHRAGIPAGGGSLIKWEHRTFNIQHRTSNDWGFARRCQLDVRCCFNPPSAGFTLRQQHHSLKFTNCTGTGKSCVRTAPMTVCSSSRLLPVTRMASP